MIPEGLSTTSESSWMPQHIFHPKYSWGPARPPTSRPNYSNSSLNFKEHLLVWFGFKWKACIGFSLPVHGVLKRSHTAPVSRFDIHWTGKK